MTDTNITQLTGWVDSTALEYEYGEVAEPLLVYSTREALIAAHPCLQAQDGGCHPLHIIITVSPVGER